MTNIATVARVAVRGVALYRRFRNPRPSTNPGTNRILEWLQDATEAVLDNQKTILKELEFMGKSLDKLTAEVAETKAAVATAVEVLKKLVNQTPDAELDKLSASLDEDQASLLSAVREAEGGPVVEPPPVEV